MQGWGGSCMGGVGHADVMKCCHSTLECDPMVLGYIHGT